MMKSDGRGPRGFPWDWAILIAVSLALVGWGLLLYRLIPDRPRTWDYGVFKDTPGQSIYSTARPPSGGPPQPQIAPLPEAVRKRPQGPTRSPGATPGEVKKEPGSN